MSLIKRKNNTSTEKVNIKFDAEIKTRKQLKEFKANFASINPDYSFWECEFNPSHINLKGKVIKIKRSLDDLNIPFFMAYKIVEKGYNIYYFL